MCTFHFYCPEASWPASAPLNYETAETVLSDWWTGLKPYYTEKTVLNEFKWYREDDLEPPWGPPARVTAKNVPGTDLGSAQLPPQIAVAVTEWTGYQEVQEGRMVRHWGRFYMPAPAATVSDVEGRVSFAFRTNLCSLTDTMYAGMTAAGLIPAVRMTGWGGEDPDYFPPGVSEAAWVPVREIRVNDIFDTIRRRKWESITAVSTADTFAGD